MLPPFIVGILSDLFDHVIFLVDLHGAACVEGVALAELLTDLELGPLCLAHGDESLALILILRVSADVVLDLKSPVGPARVELDGEPFLVLAVVDLEVAGGGGEVPVPSR